MPVTPVRPPEYRRREPEKEPLYQILAGHLEAFLQHTRTSEHQLPLHVEKEMRAYLECGILAYGFVRARCEDCGKSRAVAFSCKKRGFCPSCCGRRMADTAARLVDDVLPRVPVRQWVLSFPYEIRIIRLCTKRGLLDDTAADPLTDEEPVLAALTAASVRGITATGARAGQRLRRVLKDAATGVRTAPLCFASRGFSLHAATRIAGPDRSDLDPDLSGGGRAAGGAPAEGPASAAVRVRRLTCLLDPSPSRSPGVRLGVPSTAPQAPY